MTASIIINLPQAAIISQPVPAKTTNTITILSYNDDMIGQKVIAYTKEVGPVILWTGASYSEIGQWTDNDAKNRILQLFS